MKLVRVVVVLAALGILGTLTMWSGGGIAVSGGAGKNRLLVDR